MNAVARNSCGDEEDSGCREEHETTRHPVCGHLTCNYYRQEEKETKCRECDLMKESKTATVKKKESSTDHFKCSLADLSAGDLRAMKQAIDKELKKRKTVQDMMTELSDAYDAIDWENSDRKCEKTGDAVREIESLHSKEAEARKASLALTDVEQKWDAALSCSTLIAGMISPQKTMLVNE
jgi:hypothetical protein